MKAAVFTDANFDASAVIKAVRGFLEENPGLKRLLVAYSGGPDSSALLEALHLLSAGFKLQLFACWVNHNLRSKEELQAERVFVESFCAKRSIPVLVFEAEPGQIKAAGRVSQNGGVEAAARDFRHKCLEKARSENSCDAIVLAHTLDDVLETMVMRFFTGSGTGGLRGIAPASAWLRRPLLGIGKDAIYKFLEHKSLEYRFDSTNEQRDYLRNHVRHSLMPQIHTVFPNLSMALSTSARKASIEDDALNSYAQELLVPAAVLPGSPYLPFRIPSAIFNQAPLAVRIRALYLVARSFSSRIPWNFMHNAARNNKSSGLLAEGVGISIYSDRGSIWIRRSAEPDTAASFEFVARTFGEYMIGKELSFGLYCSSAAGLLSVSSIRSDSFAWPLRLRSAKASDILMAKNKARPVSTLLLDMKIPRAQWNLVPVVEDVRGIVAVLGRICGSRDLFRYNGEIEHCESPAFLSVELKGAVFKDGI